MVLILQQKFHDLQLNFGLYVEFSFIYNFAFELWALGNLHGFICLLDQESHLINYLQLKSSVHDRNIILIHDLCSYQELIKVIQVSNKASCSQQSQES